MITFRSSWESHANRSGKCMKIRPPKLCEMWSRIPAYTLFFFSGMLNETNETKFYYKTNDKKKTKKQQDSSYKKIKNPGPTLQCPRCFLEAGSSKESERGRFGAGDKRAD